MAPFTIIVLFITRPSMGKKRGKLGEKNSRSNTNNASLVVARIAKQSVPTHAPQETFGGFHRLDEETIKYFLEVKSHLDTLENPEEQALLVRGPHS